MKKIVTLSFLSLFMGFNITFAQSYQQNFDGNDTLPFAQPIVVALDTSSENIWQIGAPHKHYFNSAYSLPNVIVTDTSLTYPVNNISRFSFKIPVNGFPFGAYTIQWLQKIDMDSAQDGGIVEVSTDGGNTWRNVFTDPNVYNLIGFNAVNKDTLPSGEIAFSGTDTSWRDIWLCYNLGNLSNVDTLQYRFTFKSDSVNSNREGWMMDNFSAHIENLHPVKAVNSDPDLMVYPRMTYGPINIKPKLTDGTVRLQTAELITETGQTVARFTIGPGDSNINIGGKASGWYLLKVTTAGFIKSYSIWLSKN